VPDLGVKGPNVKWKRIWWLPGKVYNLFLRLPIGIPIDTLAGTRPNIFFFPNFVRWPLLWTKNSIVVVHDVSFIESAATMVPIHRLYLKRVVPKSIKKASQVISISESTKNQLITHYGTDPDKITVVYPAIDHEIYRPADDARINTTKQKVGIEGEYILYLGTLEPRKNIIGIVKSYSSLPSHIKDKYKLVLAGGKGWLDEEINQAIESLPKDRVIRTGYVEGEDIAPLYSGAAVYVYPSHYEGWGMQVLEAMACGAPVVTSNNSSLPEAGGDAALYVDSKKASELTLAIERVLTDENLRKEMIKKGFKHAKKFTWEKSAQTLLEVFDRLD
jgi:glycosyltransferase involved in cell wall biosynthesis